MRVASRQRLRLLRQVALRLRARCRGCQHDGLLQRQWLRLVLLLLGRYWACLLLRLWLVLLLLGRYWACLLLRLWLVLLLLERRSVCI